MKTILIADDHPVDREFLITGLDVRGWRLLEALRQDTPRAVLTPGNDVAELHFDLVSSKLREKLLELQLLQQLLELRVTQGAAELQVEVERRRQTEQALEAANRRLQEEALRNGLTGRTTGVSSTRRRGANSPRRSATTCR